MSASETDIPRQENASKYNRKAKKVHRVLFTFARLCKPLSKASSRTVKWWLQLGFDSQSTALRPFVDLYYERVGLPP